MAAGNENGRPGGCPRRLPLVLLDLGVIHGRWCFAALEMRLGVFLGERRVGRQDDVDRALFVRAMARGLSLNAKPARTLYTRAACTCLGDSTPCPDHLDTRGNALRFIEPCLPSPADRPPSGSNWIHEIKHDGYRLMARRDRLPVQIQRHHRRREAACLHCDPVSRSLGHARLIGQQAGGAGFLGAHEART
jgi:hypothetical protein